MKSDGLSSPLQRRQGQTPAKNNLCVFVSQRRDSATQATVSQATSAWPGHQMDRIVASGQDAKGLLRWSQFSIGSRAEWRITRIRAFSPAILDFYLSHCYSIAWDRL